MANSYRGRTVPDDEITKAWHAADPEHQHGDVDFFIKPVPGREHFVIDRDGKPLLYVTVENVARVHIQFNPEGSKIKILKGLIEGFKWLANSLQARGYREMIFDSRFPSLIKFCQSALGFLKRDNDYSTRF